MELSRAGHEKLIRLRVAIEAKQKILFHQLVQRRSQLVFVRARLRFDRISHRGLGNGHGLDENLVSLGAKRVARSA